MRQLSPLIYFFPGKQVPIEKRARFTKGKYASTHCGPNREPGILASPFSQGQIEYNPKAQNWNKAGGYWIGSPKKYKPTEFARETITPGYSVNLADGKKWTIPVAYLCSEDDGLSLAEGIWTGLERPKGDNHLDSTVESLCQAAIAMNYDLTPLEVAALKLLNRDSCIGIMGAISDQHGNGRTRQTKATEKRNQENAQNKL